MVKVVETMRVELPLRSPSKILKTCKTMGELRKKFASLDILKYIYLDPLDNKLKGVNPPNNTPIVANAYITVNGKISDIIKFTKEATQI